MYGVRAAGIKIRDPTAITHKPIVIPFIKPVFFKTAEDGSAITKYET
jgi:hypothetical protein